MSLNEVAGVRGGPMRIQSLASASRDTLPASTHPQQPSCGFQRTAQQRVLPPAHAPQPRFRASEYTAAARQETPLPGSVAEQIDIGIGLRRIIAVEPSAPGTAPLDPPGVGPSDRKPSNWRRQQLPRQTVGKVARHGSAHLSGPRGDFESTLIGGVGLVPDATPLTRRATRLSAPSARRRKRGHAARAARAASRCGPVRRGGRRVLRGAGCRGRWAPLGLGEVVTIETVRTDSASAIATDEQIDVPNVLRLEPTTAVGGCVSSRSHTSVAPAGGASGSRTRVSPPTRRRSTPRRAPSLDSASSDLDSASSEDVRHTISTALPPHPGSLLAIAGRASSCRPPHRSYPREVGPCPRHRPAHQVSANSRISG